jgi:hypothetical protein
VQQAAEQLSAEIEHDPLADALGQVALRDADRTAGDRGGDAEPDQLEGMVERGVRAGQVVDQGAEDQRRDEPQRSGRQDAGQRDQRRPPVRAEVHEDAPREALVDPPVSVVLAPVRLHGHANAVLHLGSDAKSSPRGRVKCSPRQRRRVVLSVAPDPLLEREGVCELCAGPRLSTVQGSGDPGADRLVRIALTESPVRRDTRRRS